MACAWNREYRQAIAYARQEIDLARRCHAPYLLRHVYTHLTVTYALAGELAEAERAYAEARTVVERLAAPEAWADFDLIAGILPMTRGDYAASEQVAIRAIEEFRAAILTRLSGIWAFSPSPAPDRARNARRWPPLTRPRRRLRRSRATVWRPCWR